MWHAGFLRRLSDTTRYFVNDDVIVGRVATEQTTETDDRIVFAGFRQSARGRGDFEAAGDTNDVQIFLVRAGSHESVPRTLQKAFGDKGIETGNHDREARARSIKLPFQGRNILLGQCLGLQFRFFLRDSVSPWRIFVFSEIPANRWRVLFSLELSGTFFQERGGAFLLIFCGAADAEQYSF